MICILLSEKVEYKKYFAKFVEGPGLGIRGVDERKIAAENIRTD